MHRSFLADGFDWVSEENRAGFSALCLEWCRLTDALLGDCRVGPGTSCIVYFDSLDCTKSNTEWFEWSNGCWIPTPDGGKFCSVVTQWDLC